MKRSHDKDGSVPRWRASLLCGLVWAAGLLFLPGRPAAADLGRLVRRGETADTRVSYEGTKVIRRFGRRGPGEERLVRIQHRAPDNTRIEFIGGGPPGAAIVRLGDR